jgi:Raf kinase inhibitor-like YbhB/YbcL family protein
MRRIAACVLAAGALALGGCGGGDGEKLTGDAPAAPSTLRVSSSAFASGGTIPPAATCGAGETSPALAIDGVPPRARSLALLVEDPDAPGGTFVHWSVWDIPPGTTRIAAGGLPRGAVEGENSFGEARYAAPCPPKGDDPHHYRFIVYALSSRLALAAGAKPNAVRDAVATRAIARGQTVGTYGR